MKTRRSWMLAVAMVSLTAGGVWAGVAYANARTTKAGDCCLDPTCPPGCSEVCPPDCPFPCCCQDPTCPPGCSEECPPCCSPDCPPDCLDGAKATANTSTVKAEAKKEDVKAEPTTCSGGKCDGGKCGPTTKTYCPPCPFCP